LLTQKAKPKDGSDKPMKMCFEKAGVEVDLIDKHPAM
jgi:hypothetical protein